MSTATLTRPETNTEHLELAGLSLDYLSPELKAELDGLSFEDVQMILDIKRRFAGDLVLDPLMYTGSAEF